MHLVFCNVRASILCRMRQRDCAGTSCKCKPCYHIPILLHRTTEGRVVQLNIVSVAILANTLLTKLLADFASVLEVPAAAVLVLRYACRPEWWTLAAPG